MRFQIQSVILWPRDERFDPREVHFRSGAVNVVSGNSKTGKSALIPIIDYCLASNDCRIPVQHIRRACSWFGVTVATEHEFLLLARPEPGRKGAASTMFFRRSSAPFDVTKITPKENASVDDVRDELSRFAGLPVVPLRDGLSKFVRDLGRPSFRDLVALVFQTQSIVANPNVLFYKGEVTEHREKLKAVFPVALGVITPEVMEKQAELEECRRLIKRKETEVEAARRSMDELLGHARSWLAVAMELGFIEAMDRDEVARLSWDAIYTKLQAMLKAQPEVQPPSLGVIEMIAEEIAGLRAEEVRVTTALSVARSRFADLTKIQGGVEGYQEALQVQADRLQIARWLREAASLPKCPFCAAPMDGPPSDLQHLCSALVQVEDELTNMGAAPAEVERELSLVRSDIRNHGTSLAAIRARLEVLEPKANPRQRERYQTLELAQFLGRLEQALLYYRRLHETGGVLDEVSSLKDRERLLAKSIDEAAIGRNLERAVRRVSEYIGKVLPHLDAERPSAPTRLDLSDLSVRIGEANAEDYLWEVGSGANWLSYHIAVMVGLHMFFLKDKRGSCVPSLLVLDQPSQVYFPRGEGEFDKVRDEDPDIAAVRGIYIALGRLVVWAKGAMQVIVMDHTTQREWGGIDGVVSDHDWREGRALVPLEWTMPREDQS